MGLPFADYMAANQWPEDRPIGREEESNTDGSDEEYEEDDDDAED